MGLFWQSPMTTTHPDPLIAVMFWWRLNCWLGADLESVGSSSPNPRTRFFYGDFFVALENLPTNGLRVELEVGKRAPGVQLVAIVINDADI
jgi:hypothetical protein